MESSSRAGISRRSRRWWRWWRFKIGLLLTLRAWLEAPLLRRFGWFRTLDRLAFRYTSHLAYEPLPHSANWFKRGALRRSDPNT